MKTEEDDQMIQDCITRDHLLSDRENTFINDIAMQDNLSDKQREWLGAIWDRVTENG
jgi:hypothetical protein